MREPEEIGKDGLQALTPLELESCRSLGDLLDALSKTSFGGRALGRAWSVLKKIADDSDCGVILTVSGAMTIAKLGPVFGSLIRTSMIDAVIATGAVVTHSLVEEVGLNHYQAPRGVPDGRLYELGFNRIFDSIEPQSNLDALEKLARRAFATLARNETYGSYELVRHLVSKLVKGQRVNGLLASALSCGVEVYVPAFTDSELGLFLFGYTQSREYGRRRQIVYDAFKDLKQYADWMRTQKRIAFLSVGGGVPRNWAQQMLPFLRSKGRDNEAASSAGLPTVIAGVRICPDTVNLGHLSGSTYSEAVTWGKLDAQSIDNFVEVHDDATIVLPILAKALLDYRSETHV
jgi:deoxyhypusine synthase